MEQKLIDIYGELTFNKKVMKQKLNKIVYKKLLDSMENGESLDETIASDVAHAMKEWAIEKGATHFTHWFQPQRGGTAEKHDAFISYDDNGDIMEKFSAGQLIQSEPDASSFPSGGMRSTFEARGYTAWDPTSPAFLIESTKTKTLVVPSVFLSWTGDVLDIKTPMLRSQRALNDSVIKLQKLLGNRYAKRTIVYLGPEQEYFLFSKALIDSRDDMQICGRTLFGANPAKGQQMDDHYFGSIKDKVLDFMEDLDHELYRRGIPAKTRHNEVAPNQFELAPMYELSNLAVDHNLQMMDIINRVADNHGLVASLHEKPLAGVNGSGKHMNWSIGDNTGVNYLEPSKSPLKNISFLMTSAAIMIGIKNFGGLLRASVADAGNDHRLGANEAPPAIMSIYFGEYLSKIFDEIEGISKITEKDVTHISMGIQNLPKVAKDTSDRNRTSPVAFTGNKFEFRAVGSTHNVAEAATIFNLLAAYGYDEISDRLSKMSGDMKANALTVLKDVLKENKSVRFEGNGYSEEWHKEAEKRGLPNKKNTPEALELFLEQSTLDLFSKYNVLSNREIESKVEIKLEAYNNIKDIELNTAVNIVNTRILPAVARQLTLVGEAAAAVSASGVKSVGLTAEVESMDKLYADMKNAVISLEKATEKIAGMDDLHKQSYAYAGEGADALAKLRELVDAAEKIVSDDIWPMAKYQELLTIL